ncbi:hypothetical protein [Nocardioides daphniae]|uniref:Lipoprotein n=1 Tax=Nocardioides daphniae TaxID=402297 RepID=A0ABQ1Q7U5_9ACTN|nr:hypothetical protein [Nocardioides daphniae]GGD17857.1 hypothetical protein GCM10007231_16140 [Nocardioides daphniae]
MRSLTRPTRRGVLAAGGAATLAVVASACDLSSSGTSEEEPARVDPDLRRVETVTAQARELASLVAGVAAAHPSLAARLGAIAACHEAHLEVLEGEDATRSPAPSEPVSLTPSSSPSPPPASSSATPDASAEVAFKDLVTRERAHVTTLGAEAGVAESGALARLFASMAAGLGMHLPALTSGSDA